MINSKTNDLLSTYSSIISKRCKEQISEKENRREINFSRKRQLRSALYEILGDYETAVFNSCESINIDVDLLNVSLPANHTYGRIRFKRENRYASIVIEIDETGSQWRTMDTAMSWRRKNRDELIIYLAETLYQDYEKYNALTYAREFAINSSQEE